MKIVPLTIHTSAINALSDLPRYSVADNIEACVKVYKSLIKGREIRILFNPEKGLYSRVDTLDEGGHSATSLDLPLRGIPKEIAEGQNVDKLIRYFAKTHLIPEKGIEGTYDRVLVRRSGNGGTTAKIPFQPGLALGSIINGKVLEEIEEFAKVKAKEETITQQMKGAENEIEILGEKIAAKAASEKSSDKALVQLWRQQVEGIEATLKTLIEKLATLPTASPFFEGFQQGLESPIDMGRSKLQVQPRGFDSLQFSSQYIWMEDSTSAIVDKASHSSKANSVSVGGDAWIFKAQVAHTWSKATSDRLTEIKKEGKTEGVLVINAFTTTRNVRSFTDLQFDRNKLQTIVDAMEANDEKAMARYGVTNRADGVKEIYLLTEAVLGGSFTALVLFLDESKMSQERKAHIEEKGNATTAHLGATYLEYGGSAGFSHAKQGGEQSEEDLLNNISKTKVTIEIISQGAIPSFARDVIEREIMKHVDLNPSKLELSKIDEADVKALTSGDDQIRNDATVRHQLKMENAQVVILNTYRGLTSDKRQQNLHTPKSVLEAYDNFSNQMTNDPDCGVPVGFNYQVFTLERLKEKLDKSDGKGKNPAIENKTATENN